MGYRIIHESGREELSFTTDRLAAIDSCNALNDLKRGRYFVEEMAIIPQAEMKAAAGRKAAAPPAPAAPQA